MPYERLKAAGHKVVVLGAEAGKKVSGKRRYRTCAKKLKGGIPKL